MDGNCKDVRNPIPGNGNGREQALYAAILAKGMYTGLAILLITFIIYISGILDPYVAFDKLSQCWSQSVGDYLKTSEYKGGWSWVSMIGCGDFLNFIGIAILAGLTIICYASILPMLIRKRDRVYSALVIIEILVLVLAASGIISSGH